MTVVKKKYSIFLAFALVAITGFFSRSSLQELLFPSAQFPKLPPGVYFGELRGARGNEDERIPIFVESIVRTSSVLFVPIEIGVEPELHPLVPQQKRPEKFQPIVIRLKDISVTLSGKGDGSIFSGSIEPQGSWTLHPIDANKFREKSSALQASFELPRWLKAKSQWALQKEQLDALKQTFSSGKDRLKGIEDVLNNESLLKEKTKSRREALSSEISRVTERRRKLAEDLRSALDDLSVLHRIRLDGQSVEVARRILRREEHWFDGSSESNAADESLEEQLAANDKVDLGKLNAAARRAEEIQELERSLHEEESLLRVLETEYQRKIVKRVPPSGQPDREAR